MQNANPRNIVSTRSRAAQVHVGSGLMEAVTARRGRSKSFCVAVSPLCRVGSYRCRFMGAWEARCFDFLLLAGGEGGRIYSC